MRDYRAVGEWSTACLLEMKVQGSSREGGLQGCGGYGGHCGWRWSGIEGSWANG